MSIPASSPTYGQMHAIAMAMQAHNSGLIKDRKYRFKKYVCVYVCVCVCMCVCVCGCVCGKLEHTSYIWTEERYICALVHARTHTHTHTRACTRYPRCFIGKEAVTWMVKQSHAQNREEALMIGNLMIITHLFQHVHAEHAFEDQFLFYEYMVRVCACVCVRERQRVSVRTYTYM